MQASEPASPLHAVVPHTVTSEPLHATMRVLAQQASDQPVSDPIPTAAIQMLGKGYPRKWLTYWHMSWAGATGGFLVSLFVSNTPDPEIAYSTGLGPRMWGVDMSLLVPTTTGVGKQPEG
jgi:hypothetical protein